MVIDAYNFLAQRTCICLPKRTNACTSANQDNTINLKSTEVIIFSGSWPGTQQLISIHHSYNL